VEFIKGTDTFIYKTRIFLRY